MEALDEKTLFIVTSDEQDSNRKLKELSSKIDIPITQIYTLVVKDEELKNDRQLNANFAIFKKGNEYYALNLGPTWPLKIANPNEKHSSKNHHSVGELIRLQSGEAIETGETIWRDETHKFIFEPPYRYNPSNAQRYLGYKLHCQLQMIYKVLTKEQFHLLQRQKNKKMPAKQNIFVSLMLAG